jgi:hypothetical protein
MTAAEHTIPIPTISKGVKELQITRGATRENKDRLLKCYRTIL